MKNQGRTKPEVKVNNSFSPERLYRTRRLRRARYLYRKIPLFAYQRMVEEYGSYAYETFLEDLRRRSPKAKRRGRNPMVRYGRYARVAKLLSEYHTTGNIELIIKANRLKAMMTKPYRVLVKRPDGKREYSFSPLIQLSSIEKLVAQINCCRGIEEVEATIAEFNRYSHVN